MKLNKTCCEDYLKSLKQGKNQIETFIVCVSELNHDFWHLPVFGQAVLMLNIQNGEVDGTISFGKQEIPITGITPGLSGSCLSVMVKRNGADVKIFLDISLDLNKTSNAGTSAMWEIVNKLKRYRRSSVPDIQTISDWF